MKQWVCGYIVLWSSKKLYKLIKYSVFAIKTDFVSFHVKIYQKRKTSATRARKKPRFVLSRRSLFLKGKLLQLYAINSCYTYIQDNEYWNGHVHMHINLSQNFIILKRSVCQNNLVSCFIVINYIRKKKQWRITTTITKFNFPFFAVFLLHYTVRK